jgi:tellurium resistance protein TerD
MINLVKEQTINLTKAVPGLTTVRAGLGWNPGKNFDLDVSVFGLTSGSGAPKLLNDSWFVYFGNKKSPNNAIEHMGDNTTGVGAGDDETININLSLLDPAIDELSIVVTIYDAVSRRQHFGDVADAYINIYNGASDVVLAQYKLTEVFTKETSVQVGSFSKKDNEWSFQAVGAGYEKELGDFVAIYK